MFKDKLLLRRIVMAIVGIAATALAVALQKTIAWGVDPFSVFTFGIGKLTGLSYSVIFPIVCAVLLMTALLIRRSLIGLIGAATLIVLFLNGYMVDFFYSITGAFWPVESTGVFTRLLLLLATMVIICIGSALYYTAALGVSPYDAQALSIADRFKKIPFKYARIGTDVFCVTVGFLCMIGESDKFDYVNFATLVFAFGMGPIIAWCRKHISEPLLKK